MKKETGCFLKSLEKPELSEKERQAEIVQKKQERAEYQKKYDADMKAKGFIKTTIVIPQEMLKAFTQLAKKARDKKKLALLKEKLDEK